MRDIYEILREKEIELERTRQEVEALRLSCPLLLDDGDPAPTTFTADIEWEEQNNVVPLATDERAAASLALIRARLLAAKPRSVAKEPEKNVLLKFRRVALDASRTLLNRVRNSRLLGPEFQRKNVRDLLERLSNAA